jgi:hypothetical protein
LKDLIGFEIHFTLAYCFYADAEFKVFSDAIRRGEWYRFRAKATGLIRAWV